MFRKTTKEFRIAVLIPCLNEEKTIGEVVKSFRAELPEAALIVFDNASTDQTAAVAMQAGAQVAFEPRRGKGAVVQSMFEKVDADVYVIVDGDNTYPADQVKALIQPVLEDAADMTVASRIMMEGKRGFKFLNWIGNIFFQNIINLFFGTHLTDILSGYRAISRKLAKRLPIFATGFDIEAELTIKSLIRGYRLMEIPVELKPREAGSYSKIRIWRDGIKIMGMIFALFRDYKPFTFFGALGLLFTLAGLVPGGRAAIGYFETGLLVHLPSAILSLGLILIGMVLIAIGLILHTINRRFRELEYLLRLSGE